VRAPAAPLIAGHLGYCDDGLSVTDDLEFSQRSCQQIAAAAQQQPVEIVLILLAAEFCMT
jgi:hypothetical protein